MNKIITYVYITIILPYMHHGENILMHFLNMLKITIFFSRLQSKHSLTHIQWYHVMARSRRDRWFEFEILEYSSYREKIKLHASSKGSKSYVEVSNDMTYPGSIKQYKASCMQYSFGDVRNYWRSEYCFTKNINIMTLYHGIFTSIINEHKTSTLFFNS